MSKVSEITDRISGLFKKVESLIDFDDFVVLTSAVTESGYFDAFENTISICHETGNVGALTEFLICQMNRFKM